MALSTRFRQLRTRLSELRRTMLPAKFSPTGSYPDRTEDRARGYRLLVHAEIEAYLEDVAKAVVIHRIREWKQHRVPSNLLLAFLACYHSSWLEYDEEQQVRIVEMAKWRKPIKEAVEEIVNLAQKQFVQKLLENHGVRRENLVALVVPAGVDLDALDGTWLSEMDDFGKRRGEIAHGTKSVTATVNPKDEHERVKRLLVGLADLDRLIHAVL